MEWKGEKGSAYPRLDVNAGGKKACNYARLPKDTMDTMAWLVDWVEMERERIHDAGEAAFGETDWRVLWTPTFVERTIHHFVHNITREWCRETSGRGWKVVESYPDPLNPLVITREVLVDKLGGSVKDVELLSRNFARVRKGGGEEGEEEDDGEERQPWTGFDTYQNALQWMESKNKQAVGKNVKVDEEPGATPDGDAGECDPCFPAGPSVADVAC